MMLNSLCAISTEMGEEKKKKRLNDLEYPKKVWLAHEEYSLVSYLTLNTQMW